MQSASINYSENIKSTIITCEASEYQLWKIVNLWTQFAFEKNSVNKNQSKMSTLLNY